MAAAVALIVVLTRPGGTPTTGGEVFLQPAGSVGQDPFTESTATAPGAQEPQPTPTGPVPTTGTTATRSVSGAQPGLYGGTRDLASCDVEKQVRVLVAEPAKNSAFAEALGIRPAAVPGYLRSLTPVRLRLDTRVTNHGYKDGRAAPYQAVLEAGTAVLVDDRGVPRVRCACGNPLGEPVALKPDSKRYGQPWSAYHPQNVVVIAPSVKIVNKIVIYDHQDKRWYERDRGAKPDPDERIAPPVLPTPPVTTAPPSRSPSDTDTPTDTDTGAPTDTDTPTGPSSDTDTGSPTDTGTPTESGSDTDRERDAGTPTDPGTPADSGTPADPETSTDTGTPTGAQQKPGLTDRSGTPTGTATSGPPAVPPSSGTAPAPPAR
ncbi:DUF6777 domain-containing protein [Streptomyces antarcticus]|uniref:DUF6777 domain-containing protein n=1 Tax=Streptomyces antarcticus TaxID=2996458 RepID=UPI0022B032FD|nr:DUF6777 domain-containing protein [Streptomyces sp. H34-S5]MCZ4087544.1 hypothetical protein [Streptomyces sp. H34-S5]